MQLQERIDLLVNLGFHLKEMGDYLEAVIHRTHFNNNWFTKENQKTSIIAIATQFLERSKLENWVQQYHISEPKSAQKVGLVLAGNIPLVGFHDWLCVFITGHKAIIKLSEKDQYLLPYFFKWMGEQHPDFSSYVEVRETIKGFDAVIATGSNNSARYFEAYFGKYPNIIRKNRNSIAVLHGSETKEDLIALGHDIFQYFGLGCRNVSKIWVPENYNFDFFLETMHDEYKQLINHTKYKNNYDYNYALYQLNQVPFLMNGCIILTENEANTSRIATLHYQKYADLSGLSNILNQQKEDIQCVVSQQEIPKTPTLKLGQAQQPTLTDYADGIDTVKFLLSLNR